MACVHDHYTIVSRIENGSVLIRPEHQQWLCTVHTILVRMVMYCSYHYALYTYTAPLWYANTRTIHQDQTLNCVLSQCDSDMPLCPFISHLCPHTHAPVIHCAAMHLAYAYVPLVITGTAYPYAPMHVCPSTTHMPPYAYVPQRITHAPTRMPLYCNTSHL